ncbi:MAG: hypothetical protein ACI915_000127 [Gammaproteobacteria bacterium]
MKAICSSLETKDYYAQDTAGNVWYFGEDLTDFIYDDDGMLLGTNDSSSWLAGKNDALPGFIMRADPILGFGYLQEFAVADDALDFATIDGVGVEVTIGIGTSTNGVRILEDSLLDPDFREFKHYAPGIGLILAAEDLDENLQNPFLSVELAAPVAVPAALPLLISGLAGLGFVSRRTHEPASA